MHRNSGGIHRLTDPQSVTHTIRLKHFDAKKSKKNLQSDCSSAKSYTVTNLTAVSNSPACLQLNPEQQPEGKHGMISLTETRQPTNKG